MYEENIKLLKALADTTRLEIIEFLKSGKERTATDIQIGLNKKKEEQSAISQKLRILVEAKILTERKEGRKKQYKIRDPQIFMVLKAIDVFISDRKKEQVDEITESDIFDTLH
jgi:DNA-binding transcriptional ArsR family regulator